MEISSSTRRSQLLRGAVIAGEALPAAGGGAARRGGGRRQRALPPRDHGAARGRLRRPAARVRHPPPRVLAARLRAARGVGRDPARGRGQERRLLGHVPRRQPRVRRHGRPGQDPGALQRHRDLHRQGHRLPVVEARSARRPRRVAARFRLPPLRRLEPGGAGGAGELRRRRSVSSPRPPPIPAERLDGRSFGAARPGLQRDRRPPVLSPEGGQGGGAGARPPGGRRRLDPLRLRDGGADPGGGAGHRGAQRRRRSVSATKRCPRPTSRCPADGGSASAPTSSSMCSSTPPKTPSSIASRAAAPRPMLPIGRGPSPSARCAT